MTWNHRIIATRNESYHEELGEYSYAIHEVYYDNEGNILTWTEEPVGPAGSSLLELKHDLNHMLDALNTPIIYADQVILPDNLPDEWLEGLAEKNEASSKSLNASLT